MSIQGKNSLSYKKKNVQESNTPYTGFKNITFAHEFAAAGESFIPFSSLVTPARWTESGLTNPDPSSLLNAQLQAFRPNVTVTSSAKGLIQKEEYIVYSNRIEFKDFVSEVNEVFEVEVSDIMISGNLIVDMQTIRVEGELTDTQVQFNMGYEFDVNNEEVIVFRDGLQMFRSDNNESSGTTGNYYYLDTGSGKASVIEFFEPAVGTESILVASTGGRVDNPNVSTFQEIERLQGQIDAMVPSLASLAGVPETDFQSSPNKVDLKYFGDLLIQLKADAGKVGDVKTSMLTEAQFQAQHNGTWVLMDGRSVTGTEYETITGNGSIPDARGQFLRSKDNGAGVNPDGDLALGTQSQDEFQGHWHGITFSSGAGDAQAGSDRNTIHDNLGGNMIPGRVESPQTDGVNGIPRTGQETRPKNVTINYFIKIDV